MKKYKALVPLRGDGGKTVTVGKEIELDAETAKTLLANKQIENIVEAEPAKTVETAKPKGAK